MSSGDILSRLSDCPRISAAWFTPTQGLIDELVGTFVARASDPKCLAALTAGSLAYQWTRGTVSLGLSLAKFPILRQTLSSLLGLSAESATFLQVSRALSPTLSPSPFLRDFKSTFVSFALLRSLSTFSAGQNLFLQHLFTDVGLVGSHQLTAHLGLTEMPEGDLPTQLIEAEALNWQMKAGLSLTHTLTPEVLAWQQSISLSSQTPTLFRKPLSPFLKFAWAAPEKGWEMEGAGPEKENLLLMSRGDREDPPEGPPLPYRVVDPEMMRIRNLFHRIEGLRMRMISASSEEAQRNALKEYQDLVKGLPPNLHETATELRNLSKHFLGSAVENGNFTLEAYQSLAFTLRQGDYYIYQEAQNLIQMFGQAHTQQERWRLLRGLEILSGRFKRGDPEVYETAQWLRKLFRHPSAHTQRQAFIAYRAFVDKFMKGNREVIAGETEIRLLDEDLDPKTQEIARETLTALETKLPLFVQFQRFGRRLFNLSILTKNPKI